MFLAFAISALFAWGAPAHEGKAHDADHKPCCSPGAACACCSKDAKAGECCKGKDCCKDKGDHCCHAVAEKKVEVIKPGETTKAQLK